MKIGMVYEQMGFEEEADACFESCAAYVEADESIYKSASLSSIYTREGKLEEAIEQLKTFASQDNYQYWILLFMEKDPSVEPLKQHPEFEGIMNTIKTRFWENQERLKKTLEEKGLL